MRISQKVAEECQQSYYYITYDLAAAKLAIKKMDTETPIYDNILIMLGAFHTVMTYFACLGYLIAG